MSDYSKLRESPLLRWQCSDGCEYLKRVADMDEKPHYRCAFWDSFGMPITGFTSVNVIPDLTDKRINGPHTDEPTRECPQFKATR